MYPYGYTQMQAILQAAGTNSPACPAPMQGTRKCRLLHQLLFFLFYCTIYHAVDNLLLAYNVENQDWQQCQQVRCECQVIVGPEL